ncbi:MAG: FAD-dependent oxidoreductase, partial [Anaerolineae bacterium]
MSERPAPGLTRRARTHAERTCDVLVIGAGVAGVCAAIQAARLGSSVILAEMDAVLGGNSGPNLGVHVSGAHSFHPYAGETGIIDELEAHAAAHGAKTRSYDMHYNISRLWEAELATALGQAGVIVLKRHYAREPIMEGDRIAAVMLEDLGTYGTCEIHVRHVVVDASGDGQIAYLAGAEYARGREGKDVYGERSAPAQSDAETLGTSITAL